MPKALETTLEIDLSALQHNFEYIKSKLSPETKVLGVVKAFAYGSDAKVVAKFLENLNIDYFAVAYVSEGLELRDAGIETPILVLHPQPVNFGEMIDRCLEPSLYSAKVLQEFINVASEKKQTNYPVHIKFNTGLNRLGFSENSVVRVVSELKNTNSIYAKSLFSHLAASEDLQELAFTKGQIESFKSIANRFSDQIEYKPMLHLCNTSGALNYPEAHFDMIRIGISLYGYGNSSGVDKNLRPVATLKSVISQIHEIDPGETVGYNRAFTSKNPSRTATIPIGHADGIGRQYGKENGYVLINDKPAPIIGNVCMDMIMVNVTDIDCREGDEVIIFGKYPSAVQFSETGNTISYEILTAISQRVKRLFINS